MFKVVAHELPAHAPQGLLNSRELPKNVRTVAVVFDHALKPANLSFDPAKSSQVGLLEIRIDDQGLAGAFSGCGFAGTGGHRRWGRFEHEVITLHLSWICSRDSIPIPPKGIPLRMVSQNEVEPAGPKQAAGIWW